MRKVLPNLKGHEIQSDRISGVKCITCEQVCKKSCVWISLQQCLQQFCFVQSIRQIHQMDPLGIE